MKKFLILFFAFITVCFVGFHACADSAQADRVKFNKKSILVAYYSLSGNTKTVAEKIHAQVGGDLYEIKTKNGYPKEYRLLKEVIKYQNENDICPELTDEADISKYDIIFIGTPVWYSDLSAPVRTFLANKNFKGKVIIPFVTHGGGGGGDIAVNIDDMTNGRVLQNMLVINAKDVQTSDNKIKHWLKSLK